MPATIKEIQTTGLGGAALITKKSILRAAEARGWPTKGRKSVRVTYTVSPTVALVRGVGFAGMFEKGAKPHEEPGRRKRSHKINIPGLGVFDHISHPGFHGRTFWDEGVAVAAPLITKEFQKGLEYGLRKTFG